MNPRLEKASFLEMAAIGAAFLLFTLWAANWGMEALIHNRKTRTVPDLKGRSLSAALDMLAPLDLGLRKTGVDFDPAVPIASILRQEPPAGTIVREGKTIRVVISQGGQTVQAPTLAGLPLRNAEMLLRQNQLSLGEVSEAYSLKAEKGQVLSQDPAGETSVARGALVNLVVSGGPPPAGVSLMPDFQRKSLEQVNSWAAGAGLRVNVTSDANSPFPAGTVLAQTPPPDATLSSDSAVNVTVSGRKGAALSGVSKTFVYVLPEGGSNSQVRIVLIDKYGERELFNGLRKPGSRVEVPVQSGGARAKVYLNGILVEEKDL